MNRETPTSRLLTEAETAFLLGVKRQTLRSWRHQALGPPYVKVVGAVRYLQTDLEEYLRRSRVRTERTKMR